MELLSYGKKCLQSCVKVKVIDERIMELLISTDAGIVALFNVYLHQTTVILIVMTGSAWSLDS